MPPRRVSPRAAATTTTVDRPHRDEDRAIEVGHRRARPPAGRETVARSPDSKAEHAARCSGISADELAEDLRRAAYGRTGSRPAAANPVDLEFSLPWPPTTGQEWIPIARGDKGATLVLTVDAKRFRRDVALELLAQRVPRLRIAHPCALHILAQGPSHAVDGRQIRSRHYDVGNLEKATLDALKSAELFSDDRWVDDLRIMRGEQVRRGRLYVRIRPIEAGA